MFLTSLLISLNSREYEVPDHATMMQVNVSGLRAASGLNQVVRATIDNLRVGSAFDGVPFNMIFVASGLNDLRFECDSSTVSCLSLEFN